MLKPITAVKNHLPEFDVRFVKIKYFLTSIFK
jgi:hypothetical protein